MNKLDSKTKAFLAICPVLGVTASTLGGLTAGIIILLASVCACIVANLLSKVLSGRACNIVYLIVSATIISLVGLLTAALMPSINEKIAAFIPLMVVSSFIVSKADDKMFNVKFAASTSFISTILLIVIGLIREIIGAGAIFGTKIFNSAPISIFSLAAGGFIVAGLIVGIVNSAKKEK